MTTEFDRLQAQKEAIIVREQRAIEGAMSANNVLATLTERAKWYRDGCEGLEDREGYYASGDCARDAASDLEVALAEIRVLERVIALLRLRR